ncbi:uncharacterized protein LOC127000915 isoform X2 [Eriocheir sinensis]|uniref:uncharacterized protein LOC127000915 isoform X2 n=1 Tax=Eriocheir sinensis TaxID=95602 RepID=UPI0021C7BA3F|nr:uncharacterized protein LOC127000915 isoform X2 [Eriocheir sinensis]
MKRRSRRRHRMEDCQVTQVTPNPEEEKENENEEEKEEEKEKEEEEGRGGEEEENDDEGEGESGVDEEGGGEDDGGGCGVEETVEAVTPSTTTAVTPASPPPPTTPTTTSAAATDTADTAATTPTTSTTSTTTTTSIPVALSTATTTTTTTTPTTTPTTITTTATVLSPPPPLLPLSMVNLPHASSSPPPSSPPPPPSTPPPPESSSLPPSSPLPPPQSPTPPQSPQMVVESSPSSPPPLPSLQPISSPPQSPQPPPPQSSASPSPPPVQSPPPSPPPPTNTTSTSPPPPQSPSPPPTTTSTSTQSLPAGVSQEVVVAQLNQLQQTVVSHILQYQAGVIAQFQQIQQQMLSQLGGSSSATTTTTTTTTTTQSESSTTTATTMSSINAATPTATIIPSSSPASSAITTTPLRTPSLSDRVMRKRRAPAMIKEDPPQKEIHIKRKRTAFNEKQYKVLETTFEHNNFPEPIDQHCIALRIKTPYRSIKMWFQNRRASVRKRLTPQEKGISNQDNRPVKNASDPEARWYCSLCPSTFIAKKFLDSHKEAHKMETLHCPDCHMGFTHKVLLDTHRISKCSSKTGIDLTHLKDEGIDGETLQPLPQQLRRSPRVKEEVKAASTPPPPQQQPSPAAAVVSPGLSLQAGLPLLLLQKLQKQREEQETAAAGTSSPTAQPNPLLLQQQQRLMQQLLLAQLQQAKELKQGVTVKLEQQQEEEEEEEAQQEEEEGRKEEPSDAVLRRIKEEIFIKEERQEMDQVEEEVETMDTGGGGGGGEGKAEECPYSPSSSSSSTTTTITSTTTTTSTTTATPILNTITYSEQLKQTLQQKIQQIQQNQLHLKLQQIQQKQKELLEQQEQGATSSMEETTKPTITLGALPILPLQSSSSSSASQETPRIRVKEELQDPLNASSKEPQTLQDQISSILKNHGLKSPWRTSATIKGEPQGEEGERGPQQERESMQEQIQAILRHQQEQRRKMEKTGEDEGSEETAINSIKRCRRRTTVFNEVQLRTLYLHFTHCNFPDPSMFKIIGNLTKLEPQVIKIWFQNERSRQRKRAAHFLDEVNSKEKPYKCRDCGMSFAMLTFLVKHSMRHSGETDAAAAAREGAMRTCPLCLQKWNREVFALHLKSRHNVNWSLVEERAGGSLTCHLCSQRFPDQDSLMVHKHRHLDEDHGVPPQCKQCKTTFVNAVCLEAHMETHKQPWTFRCTLCDAAFPDKVLLASHHMGHGMPLAVVSTLDRSRSQLQHTSIRKMQTRCALPDQPASLASPLAGASDNEVSSEPESGAQASPATTPKATSPSSTSTTTTTTTTSSPEVPVVSTATVLPSSAILATPQGVGTLPLTPPSSSGPVSFVKLIPIQLIPVNSSAGGQKSSGATTTFISVPVSLKGAGDCSTTTASASPIVNYLVEAPAATVKAGEALRRPRGKALPNLIPIGASPGPATLPLKEKNTSEPRSPPPSLKGRLGLRDGRNGLNAENRDRLGDQSSHEAEGQGTEAGKGAGETWASQDTLPLPQQIGGKKRYVPILPMIPLLDTPPHSTPPSTTTTTTTTTTRRPRAAATKRPWVGSDYKGYKRRRTPTYFTGSQRDVLEVHFEYNNFPEPVEQFAISTQLGVEYPVVKTWFQNTRKNMRRQLKEEGKFDQDGPFHCHKCSVAFICRSAFDSHCERHKDKTSYFCGECWMYFNHPAVLNTHLMSHTGKFGDRKKKPSNYEEEEEEEEEEEVGGSLMDEDDEEEEDDDEQVKRKIGRETQTAEEEEEEEEEEEDEGKRKRKNSKGVSIQTDDNEEEDSDVDVEGVDDGGSRGTFEDDLDGCHPILQVECILDEQSEEETENGTSNSGTDSPGHKCPSCEEGFASLISLKEHMSHHCSQRRLRKRQPPSPPSAASPTSPSDARREFCTSIRCFECRSLFPDRPSFIQHFSLSRCSLNRQRIEYTEEEQSILATHYRENNFPMPAEMSLLAKRLGVRYRQIMHWFQNRRSKDRKQQRESECVWEKSPPVECLECKSTFVTERNLRNHQEAVHGVARESLAQEFVCSAAGCDATFTNEDLLVTHKLAHLPETEANGMGSHRLTILGPKPQWKNFTVTVLEAHYSDNNFPEPMDIGFIARRLEVDPLHVHMWFKERRNQHIRKLEESGREVMEEHLAVSSQRVLSKTCFTCDAAFICQTDLDTHLEMHKSSWAQMCTMCGQEFSNIIALETHWIRHGVNFMGEDAAGGEGGKDTTTATTTTATTNTTSTTTTDATTTQPPAPERAAKATFTGLQLKVLDGHYQQNHFPGTTEVWLVAKRLGLRPRQVTHWFQNRRGRERRAHKVTAPASHPCLWCGAAFISQFALRHHRRQHRLASSHHMCPRCPAVFLAAMLLETHALYHQVLPRGRLTPPNRPPDFTRDPLAVGQVRPGVVPTSTDSDDSSSEPELSIDLSAHTAPEDDQGEGQGDELDPVKAILPSAQSGVPSWHTPQPDVDGSDQEMTEMPHSADEEVMDEDLEDPEPNQTFSHKDRRGGKAAEKENGGREEAMEAEEGRSPSREPAVGEEGDLRGMEFTLTEEEVSASLERDVICEQVFFDDHSDSDSEEEEEPRLKIVSAYTLAAPESERATKSQ